jgi:GntR family transcriptional regulator/MocR family aminotransferase
MYAGSTSKTLAPGMRLAWIIPPARMRVDMITAKHASDLGSPAVPQLVLAQLISDGELEHHIRVVRKRQRGRRDALLDAVHEHLPQARVQGVAAGLHVLLTFPDLTGRVDDTDLADRIGRTGVRVHPLSYHCEHEMAPGLVIGYAAHTADQLREAVRRIAQVLNARGAGAV